MGRPPFGEEVDVGKCYVCGDKVVIPPGVIYDGEKMHKHCYLQRRREDVMADVYEPLFARTEQEIEDLMSNMGPMSDG